MPSPSLWRVRNLRLIGASTTGEWRWRYPWFLFARPAGVITDRFDHRRILYCAGGLRVLLTLAPLTLALIASPGTAPVLMMAALTFLPGCAEVLRANTAQTFVLTVVEKSQLEVANGALWACEQMAGKFIGPPQGRVPDCSFGRTALWRGCSPTGGRGRPDCRHDTAPPVAATEPGNMDDGAAPRAWVAGQRVLGLDALGYGLLLTLAACGIIAGTLIGPVILRRVRPATAILFGMACFTAACAVLALHSPAWMVAAAMIVNSFAGMLWNSHRQRQIPAPLPGRVNSLFRFVGTGPAAFGAFAFGALIAWAAPAGPVQPVLLPYAVAAVVGGMLTVRAAFRLRLG